METVVKSNLGDLLIAEHLIERDKLMQAQRAASRLGTPLVTILLDQKLIKEETLATTLKQRLGLEVFSSIETPVDLEAVHEVPFEEANRYRLLPLQLKIRGNLRCLRVAMVNPLDTQAIEDLEFSTATTVEPLIARASELAEALRHYYRSTPAKLASRLRDNSMGLGAWGGNTPIAPSDRLGRRLERPLPGIAKEKEIKDEEVQLAKHQIEALLNLLISKGLVTRDEFNGELRTLLDLLGGK